MKGWTQDGTETELTRQQEVAVRKMLAWHDTGKGCLLPSMGKGGGKTTVMCTVARYLRNGYDASPDGTPVIRPDWQEPATDWSQPRGMHQIMGQADLPPYEPGRMTAEEQLKAGMSYIRHRYGHARSTGADEVKTAVLPEGTFQVTAHYARVEGDGGETIGWQVTSMEATLDGEPVCYPRSQELADKAGFIPPELIVWLN